MPIPVLAIHGGAGVITRDKLTPEREATVRGALRDFLSDAYGLLENGGTAVDAVERAVQLLEDREPFNAGRGSVLNADGEVEMDASIMDGHTRRAGAVTLVRGIRNPILAARLVMEHTRHVCLGGEAAEAFAREHGLAFQDASYFITPHRRSQWEEVRAQGRVALDHDASTGGTVGAVALDATGHVAAATSTGGMVNKLPGRVGDSPLIGAGTWADDRTCAVSGTGDGDVFVRVAFAHEVDAQMRIGGVSLRDACLRALVRIQEAGGTGGCVAVNRQGEVAMPFNSPGMYRGAIGSRGRTVVRIFDEESGDGG